MNSYAQTRNTSNLKISLNISTTCLPISYDAYKRLLSEAGTLHANIGISMHHQQTNMKPQALSSDDVEPCLHHYKQAVKYLSLISRLPSSTSSNELKIHPPDEAQRKLERRVRDLRGQYQMIKQYHTQGTSSQAPTIQTSDSVEPPPDEQSSSTLHYFTDVLPLAFDTKTSPLKYSKPYLMFIVLFNMATVYHKTLKQHGMAYFFLKKAVHHAPNPSYFVRINNNAALLLSECYEMKSEAVKILGEILLFIKQHGKESKEGIICTSDKGRILLNASRLHHQMGLMKEATDLYNQYVAV